MAEKYTKKEIEQLWEIVRNPLRCKSNCGGCELSRGIDDAGNCPVYKKWNSSDLPVVTGMWEITGHLAKQLLFEYIFGEASEEEI